MFINHISRIGGIILNLLSVRFLHFFSKLSLWDNKYLKTEIVLWLTTSGHKVGVADSVCVSLHVCGVACMHKTC